MNESTLVQREEWESDLDWLARNVHVWPAGDHQPWCYVYMAHGGVMKAAGNFLDAVAKPTMITIDQWLARRAEFQNKPSWEDHPDAKCFVQNSCGHWWKNTETGKVEPSGEYWRVHDGVVLRCASTAWVELNKGELLGDWRDTLEKRPEGSMVSMSGVHSNGDMEKLLDELNDIDESIFGDGFIPKDAATAKQQAPKGSGNPILGMVLADLTNRALEGKEKYGEPLLAHNGRNALWDLYQELLDAAMYIRQAIEEQK
jgi:hypothetical protein